AEPVCGGVKRRPRRVDGVDPPAGGEEALKRVGNDAPDVAQRAACHAVEPASEKDAGDTCSDDAQEGGPTYAALTHAAAIPVPMGQLTPVPPIPQYPPGFFC